MNSRICFLTFVLAAFFTSCSWARSGELKSIQFILGDKLWQPGKTYRSGSDWLGLICDGHTCAFEPAKLKVKSKLWRGHYDEASTAGQSLNFSRVGRGKGKVVAWFHVDKRHDWLKQGAVTTYASNTSRLIPPNTEGTLEVAIALPGDKKLWFVPLFNQLDRVFHLQLRVDGQRMMLGELSTCSHEVSTSYFVWAGDMDGDGRPDFLISLIDDDGEAVLYLSTKATRGQIAGIAGVYTAPPFGGECDGSGWLDASSN